VRHVETILCTAAQEKKAGVELLLNGVFVKDYFYLPT
jgi:hypothetical protein